MLKGYKYRLYPNKEQTARLDEMLETCRRYYNRLLAERRDAWQQEQRSVGYYDQKYRLKDERKGNPYMGKVNFSVLDDALRRLDKAYQAFFRRVKRGEKPGYPRFKARGRYDSSTYQLYGSGCKLNGNRLYLQGVGDVKVHIHRPVPERRKTVTVRKQADLWYVVIACEVEPQLLPPSDAAVGVDVGLEAFATTSDGERFASAQHLTRAERQLRRLQRCVSRRKKGSTRRLKAVQLLARAHLRVANQRHSMAHTVARSLVNQYGTIAVEDLTVKNMVKNPHLAKSIHDAAWSQFATVLESKGAEAGRRVVRVDPRNTSQLCSECGTVVQKPLSQRWHACPNCGASMHRDVNAARNILKRAVG